MSLPGKVWRGCCGSGRFLVEKLDAGESVCSPHRRIQVLACVILLFAVGVAMRLYNLQEMEFPRWNEIASKQHLSRVTVQGARGTIYDAQGRVLAVSVKTLSVAAHPKKIKDHQQLAKDLAPLVPEGEKEVLRRLSQNKPFVWLASGVPVAVEPLLHEYETQGISAIEEFSRVYPQGSVAGSILGRVGRDGNGLSGAERQFDALLAAQSINVSLSRDARGRLLGGMNLVETAEASINSDQRPQGSSRSHREIREEGTSVTLSIDSLIQGIVEEEVKAAAVLAKARRAMAIVMDAETGEILALAQSNEFDPNSNSGVSPDALKNGLLQDSFEPGSTLKPLVAAVAMDKKLVRAEDRVNCESGKYRVGKHMVRDVHPIGEVTFADVLIRSSNICMAKVGQKLGKAELSDALHRYGFGSTTGLELPGEAKGILRPSERWAEIDVATHSFGQGVSVTALQMVQAYSALANEGYMVQPTILKRDAKSPIPRAKLFSKETANTVAEILTGVTESKHGTGLQAAVAGVRVSGKTGTAQKARAKGRGYDPNKIFASFIGFLDANSAGVQRKLVMFAAVDEPGVYPRWGGALAGPIFRKSMERILSHMVAAPDTAA